MGVPGFNDPALASFPSAGNLYYQADAAVAVRSPGDVITGYRTSGTDGESVEGGGASKLMFGEGAYTGKGEPIVHSSMASRGHWSEILNFHGSPAPWVLIGILLVAGILHFSAKGQFGARA